MNIQLLIYLGLLAALFTTTIIIGRLKRAMVALEDLIASSPAVCYSCRMYGVIRKPSIGNPDGVPLHLRLQDHEYVDARLVYIPDELLR